MKTIIQNKHKMTALLEMHRQLVYSGYKSRKVQNYLYLVEITGKTVLELWCQEWNDCLHIQTSFFPPLCPGSFLPSMAGFLESWVCFISMQNSGKSIGVLQALLALQDELMPRYSRFLRKGLEEKLWRRLEEEEWKKKRPADMEMLLHVIEVERQQEIKKKKTSKKLLWLNALEEMVMLWG